MNSGSIEEVNFVSRLASIESSLDKLQADFESTTWRKSSVVESCIKLAKSEINASIQKFIENENEDSDHMANLAWLHVEFGRSLIDAETTEGLLGEGRFLELSGHSTTSSLLVKYFCSLEQKVIQLRTKVRELQEASHK
jgi:hypothetical protein